MDSPRGISRVLLLTIVVIIVVVAAVMGFIALSRSRSSSAQTVSTISSSVPSLSTSNQTSVLTAFSSYQPTSTSVGCSTATGPIDFACTSSST
jgi:hypothetical protein